MAGILLEKLKRLKKIKQYFQHTVLPIDILLSKILSFLSLFRSAVFFPTKKSPLKIGWCSAFPPIPNGAAVMTEKVILRLLTLQKEENIELYAIPDKGKIDKKKFKGIKFARVSDPLDVIFFFSTEYLFKRYHPQTKYVAWQTLHFFLKEKATELDIFSILQKMDFVIVPTKMAKKEYRHYGIKNIMYIPEGIELQKYFYADHKQKKVAFISRSMYYKGLMPFLDAVPLIIKSNPDVTIDVHASLDTNSEYLEEMLALLKQRKNEFPKQFLYTLDWSSEEEIRKLYYDAAVLIFPSNNEGFGIPLVEAMASGTLCIVGDRPPMNELVEHNKTGICVPLKKQKKYHNLPFPEPSALARMCNEVLKDFENKKWKELRIRARKKVEQEYNITTTAEALIKCARDVTKRA